MQEIIARVIVALLCLAAASAQVAPSSMPQWTVPDTSNTTLWGVHDPSMIHAGDTWYVFSTTGHTAGPQLPIHCSNDLVSWKPCGHIFPETPAWIRARLPSVRDLWAPDISFEDGEYRVYYAYSLYATNVSGIALVTNRTLDPASSEYAWVDRGSVLETSARDDFNAIDPNFVRDGDSQDWLAYGSFYSGIKLRRLAQDGLLDPKNRHQYSLAKRKKPDGAEWPPQGDLAEWEAIEAPYIVRHGDYYYLFTSWDLCCHGASSNYRVVIGRSMNINGPYVDEQGQKLSDGGGTTILASKDLWVGPGGQSVGRGPNGPDILIYHAYDKMTGRVSMRLSHIDWSHEWPAVPRTE